MSNNIYATFDKSFDIGCNVVKWSDPNGMSFLPLGGFTKRNWDYETLKKNISQFTLHWSATYKASHTFSGLKARKLSCNFIIDDDNVDGFATIYQCLPIQHAGWSQGTGLNALGPGVEISYQPTLYNSDMYDEGDQKKFNVPPHSSKIASVHGSKLAVHLPTQAQLNSLYNLVWGFCELFPDVPPRFPRDANNNFNLTVLKDPKGYRGLVNHYNLRRDKIDAAGLDLQQIEDEVEKRLKTGY